jgi:hypothetical protein
MYVVQEGRDSEVCTGLVSTMPALHTGTYILNSLQRRMPLLLRCMGYVYGFSDIVYNR